MDDNNSTPPPPDLSFSPHTPIPTHNFLYSTTAAAAVSAAAASTNAITFPSPLTIIPSTATPPTVPNPIPLQSHPPFKHQTKPRKKRSKLLRTETAGQHAGTSCSAVASAPQAAPPKPPKTGSSKKPDPSAPKITEPCTECGKTFWSWKALFGHMRCHPERQWRGINPPPQFRARREGPPNSSTAANINVGTASSSHVPPSTSTTSAAAAAMTADDYEVSSCLLLLAAGGGTCTIPATSTSNVVDYRSDHPSGALNNMALVPFDQPPPEISSRQADMGEAAGTSSMQKAGTSSVTAAYDAHHLVEELSAATTSGGGFTTRFECSSCKKTFGSHQALGGHRASHKNVKGCFAITRTADQPADQEITYYDRGTAGSSAAYHHWQDNVGSEGAGGGEATTGLGSDMGLGLALGFGGGGGHRCGICMRVFSSGQALGGHKRCHWEKGSEDGGGGGSGGGSDPAAAVVELGHGIGSSSTSGTRDWSGVGDGLDLNFFPAPIRGCDHDHPSLTASTSAAAASSSADLQLDLRLGR